MRQTAALWRSFRDELYRKLSVTSALEDFSFTLFNGTPWQKVIIKGLVNVLIHSTVPYLGPCSHSLKSYIPDPFLSSCSFSDEPPTVRLTTGNFGDSDLGNNTAREIVCFINLHCRECWENIKLFSRLVYWRIWTQNYKYIDNISFERWTSGQYISQKENSRLTGKPGMVQCWEHSPPTNLGVHDTYQGGNKHTNKISKKSSRQVPD